MNEIKISNENLLKNKLNTYSLKTISNLQKGIEKGCLRIEGDAKKKCPCDTGLLRSSIQHRVENKDTNVEGIIGTKTEYASFVEFGTSKQRPQPYLVPAYKENLEQIKNDIENFLKW